MHKHFSDKLVDMPDHNDQSEPKTAPELPEDELQNELPTVSDSEADESESNEAENHDNELVESDEHEPEDVDNSSPNEDGSPRAKSTSLKKLFRGYWHKRKWTIPLTIFAVLAIIFVLPWTRYPILSLVLKRPYSVTIVDSKTNTPVSGASVTLDGVSVTTDSNGRASFKQKVGKGRLTITKQYYEAMTSQVFVGISTVHNTDSVKLVATGRQVPLTVVNKVTGKPIADAEIKVLDTTAKTDANGMATIVLPTTAQTQPATISATNYNNLSTNVEVTSDVVSENKFAVTPTGKVYFLSNLSGNIDVVSTNLDGTSRQTIVAGTGNEDSVNTVLLASRDWKYLALLSKRDGGNFAKLFLINTSNNQLTTIEATASNFTPIGWSDHHFMYLASNPAIQLWQPGGQTLKSFNADSGASTTIDQTSAEGVSSFDYVFQTFPTYNIIGDQLVYSKQWSSSYGSTRMGEKTAQILSVGADGSNKSDLKDFSLSNSSPYVYISEVTYHPQDLYFQASSNSGTTYYEYKNGNITQTNTLTTTSFTQPYPTYLVSPSDNQTFWTQPQDGKNSLVVGDAGGNNGNQIATLSDYKAYGWFTDDYVLVSNNGSELYIMPSGGGSALKITDYYKAQQNYNGYGYGYGGL